MSSKSRTNLHSTSSNETSTLRPRTTRLISYLEDGSGESSSGQAISTSTSTARRASPSPSRRNVPANRRLERAISQTDLRDSQNDTSRRGSSGLWESWSQIQGIASTFLGSDAAGSGTTTKTRSTGQFKAPAWMKQDRSQTSTKQNQKWGPRAPDKIGIGPASIEERQAKVQAKRREAMLLAANEDRQDASGRHKRKGSNASLTIHSPTAADDVLVYRHKVLANDTMAGVAIKYSCQQDVFRKVNRLWPNDRIQIREHVFLPVDTCVIRGRKVDRPDDVDLLREEFTQTTISTSEGTVSTNGTTAADLTSTTNTTASSVVGDQDEDYKHDSWVSLPNFPRAVEILRVSRTTLGYFPPARRKSNQKLLGSGIESVVSSPRASFDTLRHPPTHAAQQAQLQQSLRSVSVESTPPQRPRMSSRHRSNSTMTTSSQHANRATHSFFSALQGPGGVGSLRGLRTESSRPGPAEDSLNQNFARYLPSLAITSASSTDHPLNDDHRIPHARAYSAAQTLSLPRASMDSLRSTRSGRSNSSTSAFGVGVENWVKKLASATSGAVVPSRPGTNRSNSDRTINIPGKASGVMGIGIGGETGLGDLIELETNHDNLSPLPHPDAFDHEYEDGEGGTLRTPRLGNSAFVPSERIGSVAVKSREESQLNERFPVGGKVAGAYGAKR